nr:rhombosortase [Aliidiomarina indica]
MPLERRYVLGPLGVSALLLGIFSLPESYLFQLTFEREFIAQGELWRLLTGQFVHLTWSHLILNVMGLWVMYLLFAEHISGWRYGGLVIALALASNLGMYLFDPEIHRYVGFSGVLYGLFAWGALLDVSKNIKFGWLLLIGVLFKVTWEYLQGPVELGAATVSQLATSSHFFGMVGGLTVALAMLIWSIRKKRSQ